MTINREQYIEWRDHPVTVAIKEAINLRIQESKDELSSPLSDPDRDRFLKGMIWAFKEVLEVEPDYPIEEMLDEV